VADHVAGRHQFLEGLEHVVGRRLAAGDMAVGALHRGAAAVLVVDGLLQFLEGDRHFVAGHAEVGTVGVFHSHVEAAPDHDAAHDADDEHSPDRTLWLALEPAEHALARFGSEIAR
jgi:hypothetical protein